MKKSLLKKSLLLLIALSFLIIMVTPVYAEDNPINVQLNGENILFDIAPRMVNFRVMVPMRTLFEKLGATVEWDEQNRTITATQDGTVIKLILNSSEALVTKNGAESQLKLDTLPIVVDGRILVPVRIISESLVKQVGWDDANNTVVIIDYSYFIDALKTQAPNFYEYTTNKYEVVNTGEISGSSDISFKVYSAPPIPNLNGNLNTTIKGILSEKNASIDAIIKITGLESILKESEFKNLDNISFSFLCDEKSIYIKSNLFSLLEKENIQIGDKWLKVDIADLNNPNVKNFQDLKNMQNQNPTEQFLEALAKIPLELDVKSFSQAQTFFNAFITLIDNNHFTVTSNGTTKVYTLNIKKQDLIDVVLNIQKNTGTSDNISVQDLIKLKEFTDNLVFDYTLEVVVKNNIIVENKASLNTQMDIPNKGHFELFMESNSKLLNPNKTSSVITMPNPIDVIDFKELLKLQPGLIF